MSNNFGDSFITIPADSIFFTEVAFNVERNEVLDGSKNVEINEMVKSSDIVDETVVKETHPYVRKLLRR